MHYANGREAKNGDKVVHFGYGGPVIGILYDATAGNEYCNGKIAVTKSDVLALLPTLVPALLPAQSGVLVDMGPDLFKRVALVPDTSKKETD